MSIHSYVAKSLPWAVQSKRYLVASRDAFRPIRRSYSQHGEDVYLREKLKGINLSDGVYVDVGANQPTKISNTYLFYRLGFSGITIEPNRSMEPLFRAFRPKDIFLRVGCGAVAGVAEFKHSRSSVLSSFDDNVKDIIRSEFLPILPLDSILRSMCFAHIYLLSVDVEGADLQVLQGAEESLKKTIYAVVEENVRNEAIRHYMKERGFEPETELGPNVIYANQDNYHRFKKAA